ncbi:hypothetical protein GCM10011588_33450 [Nocardia jinanensis]|uniref:Uncharacterized protein n=1 Tax=Nocardia jinanensis TaxID=382504 RepID=A0A917RP61_9NOCA|nr:hypothetical protein GCM10011588_33450 [Nocardia jinanensis]
MTRGEGRRINRGIAGIGEPMPDYECVELASWIPGSGAATTMSSQRNRNAPNRIALLGTGTPVPIDIEGDGPLLPNRFRAGPDSVPRVPLGGLPRRGRVSFGTPAVDRRDDYDSGWETLMIPAAVRVA